MYQYTQNRTPNTHRAEFIENFMMVDAINSSTEINPHDPGLLLSLQCILQYMGQAQNGITCTQTDLSDKQIVWLEAHHFIP